MYAGRDLYDSGICMAQLLRTYLPIGICVPRALAEHIITEKTGVIISTRYIIIFPMDEICSLVFLLPCLAALDKSAVAMTALTVTIKDKRYTIHDTLIRNNNNFIRTSDSTKNFYLRNRV